MGAIVSESESDVGQLFDQYRIFVSSAEEISARRATSNNYLLSVNSLLVTVHTLGRSLQPDASWQFALPAAGVIICLSWWLLIRSYKNVNEAKFIVIHKLESVLAAQPYKDESELMSEKHIPLSHIEQWIPAIFAALYLGLILLAF